MRHSQVSGGERSPYPMYAGHRNRTVKNQLKKEFSEISEALDDVPELPDNSQDYIGSSPASNSKSGQGLRKVKSTRAQMPSTDPFTPATRDEHCLTMPEPDNMETFTQGSANTESYS